MYVAKEIIHGKRDKKTKRGQIVEEKVLEMNKKVANKIGLVLEIQKILVWSLKASRSEK